MTSLASVPPSAEPTSGLASIASHPSLAGRLVFDNFRDLFVLDLASGVITQLTDDPVPDFNAAWSPDGTSIAFRSRRDGNDDIYLAGADGSNLRNLTRTLDRQEWGPTWSPDGEWIACNQSTDNPAQLQLYMIRPDRSGGHLLATDYAEFPAWSPNGREFAFASLVAGSTGLNPDYDIHIVDVDGSNERNLTSTSTIHEMYPQWTPDGSALAFMAGPVHGPATTIWRMDSNGANQRQLTSGNNAVPVWSPDGQHLAFIEVGEDIVVMNADGTDAISLGLTALGPELGFVSWAIGN